MTFSLLTPLPHLIGCHDNGVYSNKTCKNTICLLSVLRSSESLEEVYIEGGSHGVDSGQKDEQRRLWDQRLTSCQTQGAVKQANIVYRSYQACV